VADRRRGAASALDNGALDLDRPSGVEEDRRDRVRVGGPMRAMTSPSDMPVRKWRRSTGLPGRDASALRTRSDRGGGGVGGRGSRAIDGRRVPGTTDSAPSAPDGQADRLSGPQGRSW
jgi:hypothetical protein